MHNAVNLTHKQHPLTAVKQSKAASLGFVALLPQKTI